MAAVVASRHELYRYPFTLRQVHEPSVDEVPDDGVGQQAAAQGQESPPPVVRRGLKQA